MHTIPLADLPPENVKKYFSPGWISFDHFYSCQDWSSIYCSEQNPESVIVNGRIRKEKPDMPEAKRKALAFAAERIEKSSVIYIELGVREGASMKHMARCLKEPNHELHGFDTFTGLPDGWLPAWGGNPVGRFREVGEMAATKQPEFYDTRIVLHKGLFQDTLPNALPRLGEFEQRFINIDCDTYSGALFGLTLLHPYLKSGDIVYFDEFHDELNEYAAFNDYVRSYYTRDRFRLIARAYDAYCFEIT